MNLFAKVQNLLNFINFVPIVKNCALTIGMARIVCVLFDEI